MTEPVEIAGMRAIVVEAMPSDVVIIVPTLARRPGESDDDLDARRAKGAVKLVNVGRGRR